MEDFIVELLGLLFDGLVEWALAGICDLLARALKKIFNTSEVANPVIAFIIYLLFGMFTGGVTLLFFPHRTIRHAKIPGASLVLSPLIAGLMMSLTGSILRGLEKRVTRIESFGFGFAFTFGVALARFVWAR